MSNQDYNFDLDSILADFHAEEAKAAAKPAPQPQRPAPEPIARPEPQPEPRPVPTPAAEPPRRRPEPVETRPEPEAPKDEPERRRAPRRESAPEKPKKQRRPAQPAPEKPKKELAPLSKGGRAVRSALGVLFALISIVILAWGLTNLHPAVARATDRKASTRLDIAQRLSNYSNNAQSDALSELTFIPKVYTIPESDLVAPEPDQAKFGSTTNPADIQAVIDAAAPLLDGQSVAWDPNVNFVAGSEIKYYLDDTILAIAWQEDIEGYCCTVSEVKIAHSSQLKRKLAGDSYNSGVHLFATVMSEQCNAVVAINGDYYDYRPIGVTAQQRELYRFVPDKMDSCSFTASGDMIFSYAGSLTDEESTRQFIADNDIIFTVSFGPVLVDNGVLRPAEEYSGYAPGEVNSHHSRAAIGKLDNLHYLLMTVNYNPNAGYSETTTLSKFAGFVYSKGVQQAYALDGGQTSAIVMNDQLVNYVDYGKERFSSDIIYFATAMPEREEDR